MKRYYCTATWHDFPEGGSFGTVVQADSYANAELACKQEMAETYAADIDEDPDQVFDEYKHSWHMIDCFDVDDFIKRNSNDA